MGFLGTLGDIQNGIANIAGGNQNQVAKYQENGFITANLPAGDDNSLPQSAYKPGRDPRPALFRRDLIKWFVPEMGIISMYINPQSIAYNYRKVVGPPERTKGGYLVNYWGEELPTLSISGSTGSSGIEGINVLHQIYRSEQYTFDPVALSLAADSTLSGLGDLMSGATSALGGVGGGIVSNLGSSVFGINSLTKTLMPRNPPTLSSLALGIEMYYSGIVYRGFFTNMEVNEEASNMGIFRYTIGFTVTQTRGYRLNQFAHQRDPLSGPSNNGLKSNLSYRY